MMMMMNSVPSNWKRRSQLSFPWVITITLLTRLHLRPIMPIRRVLKMIVMMIMLMLVIMMIRITITLLTRLHLRPIMHIAHPESVEDTISFIIIVIAKKNASIDYERGLHTFCLIKSLSSSEGNGCKRNICGKTNWKPKNEYKIRHKSHLRLPSQTI